MLIMCTDPDFITDNLKEKISVMETHTGKLKERFRIVIPEKKRYGLLQTTLLIFYFISSCTDKSISKVYSFFKLRLDIIL